MKRSNHPIAIAAAGLSLIAPATALAQSGGPYAPIVLQLPASTRALAMGGIDVAGRDDDVLFYNPAQLAIARGMSASGERFSPTAAGGTLSAVTRFADGGVAVGMQTLSYEGFAPLFPADRASLLDGGPEPGTSTVATIGIGQTVHGLRLGAAVKYADDETSDLRVGRAALDLGISKDLSRTITAGLSVQNIGSSMTVPCFDSHVARRPTDCDGIMLADIGRGPVGLNGTTTAVLPLRTTLGLAGTSPAGPFDLAWTAGASLLRANYLTAGIGGEAGYSWLDGYDIALRAGVRRPLPGERAVTAGAGFTMDRLSIDYTVEPLAAGRVGQRIGLRIR